LNAVVEKHKTGAKNGGQKENDAGDREQSL
jgi:hypothetical protein